MRTIACVVERMQIAGVTEHGRAKTDADTRFVHHMEHAGQTFVRLTNEVTDSTRSTFGCELAFTKIEQAIGGAAITHFVIQPGERDIVAFTARSVSVDQKFRHDK